MDQFSTEKLWHSSNVMGFDVDAELHYGTPMKPVKPLFISLFPMQRTLAGSMPHFSDTGVFFPPHLAQRGVWLMTCAPTLTRPPDSPPSLFCVIGSFLSDKNFTFDSFVTLTSSFVGFEKWESCGLQRFPILNKVWFHPCNCTTHPQLQAAPWWNISSPHACVKALLNLFKLSRVRMIVVSGFLDRIKTVLTVWISATI